MAFVFIIIKFAVTIGLILFDLFIQKIAQCAVYKFVRKNNVSQTRNLAIHKTKTTAFHLAALLGIVITWGVSLENAWVSITGVIGLVAIGFFAVWSILSNIFAGVILFFYRPFKIDDYIEVLPDVITGKVKDINGFFVVLTDDDGSYIHIPNNMIYQKVIKTLK